MPGPTLSILIPAYNEESRLPGTLQSIRHYVETEFGGEGEVIVVDDGSTDDTALFCQRLQREWPTLQLVRQPHQGKGAAIRGGIEHVSRDLLLVVDADESVPISEERRLRQEILAGSDVVLGSRLVAGSTCDRTIVRFLLGLGFASLVRIMFRLPVSDPQCGFKMFSATTAKQLWPLVTESGYLADVEMLVGAKGLGMAIREVPITYRDMAGSKLSIWRDSWRMFSGLWGLRRKMRQRIGSVLA